MLKVTIKFACALFFYLMIKGCTSANKADPNLTLNRADSLSETRIDSAFRNISDSCDTMMVHLLPRFVDSLMNGDTAFMTHYFDNEKQFVDSNKKVEKIIRLLQADCITGLQRETYKRARQQLRSKQLRRGA